MRRASFAIVAVTALATSYAIGLHQASSHNKPANGRQVLYYVDPMHPSYKSKEPGIAPDCGMKLRPVYAADAGKSSQFLHLTQLPKGAVKVDKATANLVGIRLTPVVRSSSTRIIHAIGRVAPEDTRVYRLNSGTGGVIRKTYNDSVGTWVKKNQKLATYYAPDFLAVASGFLAAVERVPGAVGRDGSRTFRFNSGLARQGISSLEGYTDRLRNLGMSDAQIKRIAKTRLLPETVDVISPADGFIIARDITAGQHFSQYEEFYRIADLRLVWVIAEVYQQDEPYVMPGGPAQVVLPNDQGRLPARITDSLPESDAGGETVKVRLEVSNPRFALRPDMVVDVNLPVHMPSAITVPVDAVIDSGAHARVYVQQAEGIFGPREVETGWRYGDQVEILHGLQPGDRVVSSATFLVDSESRLEAPAPGSPHPDNGEKITAASKSKPQTKMATDPSCGMRVDTARAAATGNTLHVGSTTYYFCSHHCKKAFQNHQVASVIRHKGEND